MREEATPPPRSNHTTRRNRYDDPLSVRLLVREVLGVVVLLSVVPRVLVLGFLCDGVIMNRHMNRTSHGGQFRQPQTLAMFEHICRAHSSVPSHWQPWLHIT